MWREPRSRANTVTIAVLLVLSLGVSFLDQPLLRTASATLSTTPVPLEKRTYRLGRWAGLLPALLRRRLHSNQMDRALRLRVAELEDQVIILEQKLKDTRRELAAAADLPVDFQNNGVRPLHASTITLEADVAGLGANGWRSLCRIDRGSGDGVKPGYPVVWGRALVGTVLEVGPLGSVVRLITDPDSLIWCVNARSGSEAVAVGTGRNEIQLAYVDWRADVVAGDVFLTTGKAARLPRGLVVGVVEDTGRAGNPLEADVRLRPRVSIGSLHSVFILPWETPGVHAASTPE